jgi:hypothetical protein
MRMRSICLYFDGSMPNALAQCYEASCLKILKNPMCAEHALIQYLLVFSGGSGQKKFKEFNNQTNLRLWVRWCKITRTHAWVTSKIQVHLGCWIL